MDAPPEKVSASGSGTATAHIAGGVDPRNGEFYAWYLGSDPCAWGARATKDGFGMAGGPHIGGSVSQVPMEVFETRFPYQVVEYSFQTDSGGPGKFRGGISGVTIMKPVDHECVMGGANDRCFVPPYGIFGGMPGKHGDNYVLRAGGEKVPLNRAGGVQVSPGDTLFGPGGGGYGDPLERGSTSQHDDNECSPRRQSARRGGRSRHRPDRSAASDEAPAAEGEWKRRRSSSIGHLPYAHPFGS